MDLLGRQPVARIFPVHLAASAEGSGPKQHRLELRPERLVQFLLRQTFLMIKKVQAVPRVSFFKRLISGSDSRYDYLPVVSWQQEGDSMIVRQFIDEGISERHAYFHPPGNKDGLM